MYEFLQALSMGLTLPLMFFCGVVLYHYHGTFEHIFTLEWNKAEPRDWIAAGIYIGAVGEILDGGYWLVAWFANFYGLPIEGALMKWGVVVNLPTRESMGFMWAYGHVRADYEKQPRLSVPKLNALAVSALAAGLFGALIMYLTRPSAWV